MTQSSPPALRPALRVGAWRTIVALMLREMSTTYGRSTLGYLWAVLEPVAGIMLLAVVFSATFDSPPLGTNFSLFFATGVLPFMAYQDISQKISVALRFSRPLLFYPGVTYLDALIARFVLNSFTQVMIGSLVLTAIPFFFNVDIIVDPPTVALGFTMALVLAAGVGTINCFLLSLYPLWERTWAILNRPLFILSCVFFLFDAVPQPYREYLWWNPLIHVVGVTRSGIYATYDASYASPAYVFSVSFVALAVGLLLLRRYHKDIVND